MNFKKIFVFIILQSSLIYAHPSQFNARTTGGFVEGTQVQVHGFEFEPIEQLMPYWKISGADDQTLEEREQEISETFSHYEENVLQMSFVGSDEQLALAEDQLLAVYSSNKNNFEWKRVDEISIDNLVLCKNQKMLKVQSIENLGQEFLVWNIELKEGHVFFVGEENQIVAHNPVIVIPILSWVIGEGIILPSLAAAATIAYGVVDVISHRNETANEESRRHTSDQQAAIDLAKEAKKKKGSVTTEEAEALVEWGKEAGFGKDARGPEEHPGRKFGKEPHIHVGPVNHLPVRN